jgi:hypothetical protein
MFKDSLNAALVAGSIFSISAVACLPAFAQQQYRGSDPNLRNFYMARQQIQIIDDSPIVTNSSNPAAAAQGGGPAAGGRAPLPKAGFNSYMQSMPQNMGPLPKVENGVPKAPSPVPNGFKANAGKLKIKSAPVASGPKSYSSYKGYGGSVPQTTAMPAPASTSGDYSSSRNVQGSVLHWSRQRRGGY